VPAIAPGPSTSARPIVHTAEKIKPFEGFVLSQALRDSIVVIALSQLGTPYVFGAASPRKGFDCSGLVRYAMSQVHLAVPRTAVQQSRLGAAIERRHLQRGDLLAFGDGSEVTHIGIYIGSGRFVHASSVAGKVILSPLDRRPSRLIRPMKGARRLLATADAPT
jgi:cell wall-associated NlpC family hydrolase